MCINAIVEISAANQQCRHLAAEFQIAKLRKRSFSEMYSCPLGDSRLDIAQTYLILQFWQSIGKSPLVSMHCRSRSCCPQFPVMRCSKGIIMKYPCYTILLYRLAIPFQVSLERSTTPNCISLFNCYSFLHTCPKQFTFLSIPLWQVFTVTLSSVLQQWLFSAFRDLTPFSVAFNFNPPSNKSTCMRR